MPRGDGTGPAGLGPMTGWGRGYCLGYKVRPQRYGAPWCRGGAGRGWRWRNWATWLSGGNSAPGEWEAMYMGPAGEPENKEQQYSFLKQQVESIKNYLQDMENRLKQLNYDEPQAENEEK
ncbi:DUF5320 domain-containing protein [Zhaonella formicivorans]|uniref:DUF5320 domain-containing protein n=1 Tax=Zhaonella formicivorans TaxID=2528593 RepID=UPI0010ECE551|nr:DUF5320 domain-containing protein [Zhaonella formicivorans]